MINFLINEYNILFLFIIFTLIFAVLFDLIIGELPTLIHPVVIIGKIIDYFKYLYIRIRNKSAGLFLTLSTVIMLIAIVTSVYYIINKNLFVFFIINFIMLSSTFSIKMLLSTANDIKKDIDTDINKARKSVSYLVSRDTESLTEPYIISAAIESMTENITDSVNAPIFYYSLTSIISLYLVKYLNFNVLFYFVILIPILYRLFNTQDAMVGYETDELKYIGYVPAKIDDILNYIPSRISSYFIVISAYLLKFNWKNSLKILKRDADNCPSPNSGYTIAPSAGALNIQLIKKGTYIMGDPIKKIDSNDIKKAIKLSKLTIYLFILINILIIIIFYMVLL